MQMLFAHLDEVEDVSVVVGEGDVEEQRVVEDGGEDVPEDGVGVICGSDHGAAPDRGHQQTLAKGPRDGRDLHLGKDAEERNG